MTEKQINPHHLVGIVPMLFALLFASGCATLQQVVEPPEVTLAGVRLVEAGLAKQSYQLRLNVRNPNSISLPVRGLSYRVRLAGEDFAAGETLQAFRVPANGDTEFDLSVSTDLLRTFSGLQRMITEREESLAYELGGELQVDLPFVRALPFSKSGVVDLASRLKY